MLSLEPECRKFARGLQMNPMTLPLVTYFFDWKNVDGTYVFAMLGVVVLLYFCAIAWFQILKDPAI
jgi:hypothetical protein